MTRLFSAFCLVFAMNSSAVAGDKVKVVFKPLSHETQAHMQKQRKFVTDLVLRKSPGEQLTRTSADIALLQKIVDSRVIKKDETWKLQSLGIVYGDALAATIPGLTWWEVTDEYGKDPTLRYRATTLQLNALTMISKRVEEDREVRLEEMATSLAEFIRTKGHEYEN